MSSAGDGWGPVFTGVSWNFLDGFDRALAWLKARERGVLIAAVAFQVLFLLAMIAGRAAPLFSGRTVLLRVIPVDPRDLLRGDYVTLGYEISRIPPGSTIPGGPSESTGSTVYVTLVPEPDGRHYRGGAVTTEPPGPDVTFIRGTLADRSRIRFGIESYFVQEGKGHDYEAAIRSHRLSAEVAVTAAGEPALRRLIIE
jgi:uncharacterized membrane-anchored protein